MSMSYVFFLVSKRHSVVTPIPNNDPGGCNEVALAYKFMDLGSCSGGLNRRETAIVFTLELEDSVIGRKVLPLRICTCPKRDMEQEEKNREKQLNGHQSVLNLNIVDQTTTDVALGKKQFWVLVSFIT
jgi:tumor protein p63